jgi:hypothetical protein
MVDGSSKMATLKDWRRAPAVVGLVALALLHISAAAHQFQHSIDHDFGVCQACGTGSQLDDTFVTSVASIEIPAIADVTVASPTTQVPRKTTVAAYRTRAPPLS